MFTGMTSRIAWHAIARLALGVLRVFFLRPQTAEAIQASLAGSTRLLAGSVSRKNWPIFRASFLLPTR